MSDFLYTKIGRRIRERRESLGLSRIQAVEGINLSVEGLRLIEKGERGMSGFVVIELAKKLQTTTDYILLGTNGEEDTPGFSTPEHTFPTNEEYRKTLKALDQISDYIKRYEGVSTFPTSETEDNKKETNEKKEVFIMWIAICDDEDNFRNDLRDAVYEYSKNKRLEVAVEEYSRGEDLLNSERKYDMYLLDYMMEGLNGIETARALQERNVNSTIIFLTNYPQIVYDSFEVSPFRFFPKPLDTSKLYKAMDDYYKHFGNSYAVQLKFNRDTLSIMTNDIVYLEADNKKCFIYLMDKKLHCSKTMGAVAELLPENIFFKVSKAFFVNFNYISKYDNELIYLKNGSTVPVSRMYSTPFKEAFRDYAKGRAL